MNKRWRLIIGISLCILLCLYAKIAYLPAVAAAAPEIIRVGYFPFSGYHNIADDGYRSGYGYEYLHEISNETGWIYEYVPGTWDECLKMLENGEIDLLTSAQYTPERAEKFDFSTTPIGTSYTVLSTRPGDKRFTSGDYASFNGMKIGLLKTNSRNADLAKFSQQHNFSYSPVYFPSSKALLTALQDGAVDSILTSNLRSFDNEQIIAKFAPSPFYSIVKKGDATLLNQLNATLNKLKTTNPQLDALLYEKYYGSNNGMGLSLTREEQKYLAARPVIKAVIARESAPLLYWKDGQYAGIFPDIMRRISDDLNLEIQYIATSSYQEALNLVNRGKADIICNFFSDYDWAERNNLKITMPYMKMRYNSITLKRPRPAEISVATADNYFLNKMFVAKKFSEEQIARYATEEDCLRAILSGKQDITYLSTYAAEQFVQQNQYAPLVTALTPEFSHEISIGVYSAADPLLYSILNKEILCLNQSEVSNIIAENTLFQSANPSLTDYIYQAPLTVIAAIALILSAIIIFLAYLLLSNRRRIRHIYKLRRGAKRKPTAT